MPRKKILHRILINCPNSRKKKFSHCYTYDYGSTKGIELVVSEDAVRITARLTKAYGQDEVVSNDSKLFSDALRKALLCHIILLSKNITIRNMSVQIGEDKEPIEIPDAGVSPPVYSLVLGDLCSRMSKEWSDEKIIQSILNKPKSEYDSRMASLFALICAKSKPYQAERFIYLWMAFNGMYGYYASLLRKTEIAKSSEKLQNMLKKDWKQIVEFQKLFFHSGATVKEPDDTVFAREVISIIRKRNALSPGESAKKYAEANEAAIQELLQHGGTRAYHLTAYGYLLTQFSYYFRCNMIHGSKPIALFSYAEDAELKSLTLINALLEEFLDENLYKWFDEEFVRSDLMPKVLAASNHLQ